MNANSTSNGMVRAAVDSIRQSGADLVALNELCHDQYDKLIAELRRLGWPAGSDFARWEPALQDPRNCGGRGEGVGMFSRQPLGSADVFTLSPQEPGTTERRRMICAPLRERPRLRFCVTHVAPGDVANTPQLDDVLAKLDAYHRAGDTVILAGDLNAVPDLGRMNPFYSRTLDVPNNSGNRGPFRELDDTDPNCPGYGEPTADPVGTGGPCRSGTKIDYIFATEARISGAYSAESVDPPQSCGRRCSDHRILTGSVTVTVPD